MKSPRRKSIGGLKKLLERLFEKDPNCFWCGRKTFFTKQSQGQRVPGLTATLDHFFGKLDPRREDNREAPVGPDKYRGFVIPHVLACWECNAARGSPQFFL